MITPIDYLFAKDDKRWPHLYFIDAHDNTIEKCNGDVK